jgi:hypothetical protein
MEKNHGPRTPRVKRVTSREEAPQQDGLLAAREYDFANWFGVAVEATDQLARSVNEEDPETAAIILGLGCAALGVWAELHRIADACEAITVGWEERQT